MKKSVSLAIALAMALSLSACGGNSESGAAEAEVTTAAKNETVRDETEKDETTSDETTAPEETTTAEPAPEASPAEDFDTEESESGLTITNYKGEDTEITIPAEIGGKPVTAIGYYDYKGAFENNRNITKVVIPEGVATISANSFANCESLAEIEFPESLNEISLWWEYWDDAKTKVPFDGTPWLEAKRAENPLVIVNDILIDGRTCSRKVEIPDGVKTVCAGAFYMGTTVTSVSLPSSIEKIDAAAFYGCERLTEIVLPDNVNYIGDFAFDNCTALENVTFPNNIVEMGQDIFGRGRGAALSRYANPSISLSLCLESSNFVPWMKNKILENPLVIVNGNLINGILCTGDIVIPDSVKTIAAGAFSTSGSYDGAYIESVKLPEGITKIPYSLFYRCSNLKSVTIHDGITKIPNSFFGGCHNLKSVTIPDSVTEIGSWAFADCFELTSIAIPNNVAKIGDYAFAGSGIKSITIPGSVVEIGNYAFKGCESLQSITLPNGLKKIDSDIFGAGWNSSVPLNELTLPDSLESVAEDAFYGCECDITYKGEIYFPELYNELYTAINGN